MTIPSTAPLSVPATSKARRVTASRTAKLRIFAVVFALVALGLQIAVSLIDFFEIWFSPESYAFIGASLLWNSVELTVRLVKSHGMHPGAHVALDLIIWMGLLSAAILQILINYWEKLAVAAGCMKLVPCVLHFVLFVYACVDTHRLRKSRAISDVNGANEDDRGDGGIVVGSERLSVVKDSEQFEMTLR